VFFTGCALRCSFCQNYQLSHQGLGRKVDARALLEEIEAMIRAKGVHNVNFVTPDHFFPHVHDLISRLQGGSNAVPCVFNVSGYQSLDLLKMAGEVVDIYLPDYKYSDGSLAARLSRAGNYPRVALSALSEMIRQKGFLDACMNETEIARKGVLVRHLVLPAQVENSVNALTTLFLEFGPSLPVSIMSQYQPVVPQKAPEMNRRLHRGEFDHVLDHALSLGFQNLFVQFPEETESGESGGSPFVPDFRRAKPFGS
jgi:putative pyruvate formate lyase activating enzyme